MFSPDQMPTQIEDIGNRSMGDGVCMYSYNDSINVGNLTWQNPLIASASRMVYNYSGKLAISHTR